MSLVNGRRHARGQFSVALPISRRAIRWQYQAVATELAALLLRNGKEHAESACLLYRAAHDIAHAENIEDEEAFAFYGPYSLSVQYLLGLGLELMVKSAIVAWDAEADAKYLRNEVGHDLIAALDQAEARGFTSSAPNLRALLDVLREPYKQHWLRYERPDQFELPSSFDEIVPILETLYSEVRTKLDAD